MNDHYLCIHGHFYQPPRENPWIEAIELQDSAYPYHDWNERITAECYASNAICRILDKKGRIVQMVNNYSKISFDFGPTLLSWLQKEAPDVYNAILEADQESQQNFSGHGSALAQAYNHMILPLANTRDKVTQVVWGIQDFECRFGRKPEGMWLPETAVDLETLNILAEQEIRFTILAPHQARRVRPMGADAWEDVSHGTIDPSMAYQLSLPSGGTIALFFYDGPISRAVAFERLLQSGEEFAQRLLGGFSEGRAWPQLVNIATDGETYGHHHLFGDMALAYALQYIGSKNLARLTNYGEYLEKHPPTYEVELIENTSWSCTHGVERWRSDCGCNSGGHPGWHQRWRAPLRVAADWLRDTLAPAYEEKAGSFFKDPWEARNDYIRIILHRSPETIEEFLCQHAVRKLNEEEKISLLKLLELQRHTMLMYTSCGWFFDELSGIETVQNIHYAGRALQLALEVFGDSIKPRFLQLLGQAKSNFPEYRNGRQIFERYTQPDMVDLEKVGAHYAVSSLFNKYGKRDSLFCHTVEQEDYQSFGTEEPRVVVGRIQVTSDITHESSRFCFAVFHPGAHHLHCGVRKLRNDEAYQSLLQSVSRTFDRGDFQQLREVVEQHFGASLYSLTSVFRDEQRRILDGILDASVKETEASFRKFYERHAPVMRFLKGAGIRAPRVLFVAAEVALNAALRRAFESEELDPERIETFLKEASLGGITVDENTLEFSLRKTLVRMAERFASNPKDLSLLKTLEAGTELVKTLPFQTNLWKVQNICYEVCKTVCSGLRDRAEQGDNEAIEWMSCFRVLCENLMVSS